MIDSILEKVKKSGKRFDGKLPLCRFGNNGQYALYGGGHWIDGFYPGIFNIAYLLSNDSEFLDINKKYENFYDKRIENSNVVNEENDFLALDHDVGFIFLPYAMFRYKMFNEVKYRDMCIKAAQVLVDRYNEKGKFIRAWNTWKWDTDADFIERKKGKIIIDSMMNIPLLFQVSEITGDKRYYEIAENHAETVANYIVRDDYSTFHQYNFNYKTGEPIKGETGQGYSDDSCWSRGQAWGIYGFALAYKYTRNTRYLDISKRMTQYFMDNLSSVDMPCWDFKAKEDKFAPWDSSASAVCASGLLEIAELTGDSTYSGYALRLLNALGKWCLTDGYESAEPLLLHGCAGSVYFEESEDKIEERTIGQGLVYGDYFYMECLLKQSDIKFRIF